MRIRITSKKDGFRRAGMAHTGTQTYPADSFSPAQVAELKREPMLVVDELPEGEAAAPADEVKTKTAGKK